MSEFMMKNLRLLAGAVFLIAGLGLFGTGAGVFVTFSRFRETAQTTTATITGIIASRNGDRVSHAAYVEYEVYGTRYSGRLPSYTSGMREGQEIPILYNPDNPAEMDTEAGGTLTPLLFGGMGLLFAVLGGAFTHVEGRKILRRRRLIAEGRSVTASVVEIYRDESAAVKINGRRTHPYRVVCVWTEPEDGTIRRFESDAVWRHPGELRTVTVHMDPSDPQTYHVAV